ncbi:MAG: beta-lactamase family protein [Bryobacterales bacterium]|nr:beta-lactamase family protein [Bryobacterales bacterium]
MTPTTLLCKAEPSVTPHARPRAKSILALLLAPFVLIALFVPSLWLYMRTTATTLHPNPASIPASPSAPASPASPAPAPAAPARALEQTRQILRLGLAEQNLPALSAAIGHNGSLIYAEGFGYANLEKRTPLTPQHRLRIGTLSQALTATAVALLLEQGRLSLDDDIQAHVPAFPDKQSPITLRHLLAHQSGLLPDGEDESELFARHCARPVDALPHFAHLPLIFSPGSQFSPTPFGYILLAAALESASGQRFPDLLRDRIFTPLALHDTLPDTSPLPQRPHRASLLPSPASMATPPPHYGPGPPAPRPFLLPPAPPLLPSPSSPTLSASPLALQSGKLLRPATLKLFQTDQPLASGQPTGYALGWDLETVTIAAKRSHPPSLTNPPPPAIRYTSK